jgi:predicted acyl esterase
MLIGPPVYLDRPVYQLHEEALRWFDYWLKGRDTGIMDEPPVRCFVPGTGEWKALEDWPPADARWTTFFLHADGTLSEHEPWPGAGEVSFNESPFEHGEARFTTPPFVENTEILGPAVAKLQLSTDDTEALVFVTLLAIGVDGEETELTRGWLRASQRRLREGCPPWNPVPAHEEREALEPGKVYELTIPIVPTARYFRTGERLCVRVKCADDEPPRTSLQAVARNHVRRIRPARVTLHCDPSCPSWVELPITRGNIVGTFFSGGDITRFGLSR